MIKPCINESFSISNSTSNHDIITRHFNSPSKSILLSLSHIAPNRLRIEAQILSHKIYEEQASYYLIELLIITSSPIQGFERMKGGEQGCILNLLISISEWNQEALNDGDIISFDVQKVSMKLWRMVE